MNNLLALFTSFLQIGLFSIGGGYATMPLIQQQVVDMNHWLSMQQFTDIITISQMTPGPIAVNTSTFVGIQISGIPGAILATIGCILPGFVISILLYWFFRKHREKNLVAHTLKGMRSSSVGLIATAMMTILQLAFWQNSAINWTAIGIFAVTLFILRKWKPNTILIIALSGVAGLFLYW